MLQTEMCRYFIDRPSKPFGIILDWLQTGVLLLPDQDRLRQSLEIEIQYYGLHDALSQSHIPLVPPKGSSF